MQDDDQTEDLHYYVSYLATGLWSKRKEVDSIEEFTFGFEDTLQAPLQPLMDNLGASTYEVFEKDPVKYEQYYHAVKAAIEDKAEELQGEVTVFMLGAGRGPIVSQILKAADDSGKKVNTISRRLPLSGLAYELSVRHFDVM